ncbi:MAG TPA: YceI family protein [Caulobacteraceae bacterium]
MQRYTAVATLPGKDWFDVAQYPQARFEGTAIRQKAGDAYEAAGVLTLRGVTRPVTLPFTLDINGAAAQAKGHLDLIRSAFGVGQGAGGRGDGPMGCSRGRGRSRHRRDSRELIGARRP